MQDILNLFRREAETEHEIDAALGEKPRVLGVVGTGARESGWDSAARVGAPRAGPSVMEKGRVAGRDEGVWGRRW